MLNNQGCPRFYLVKIFEWGRQIEGENKNRKRAREKGNGSGRNGSKGNKVSN